MTASLLSVETRLALSITRVALLFLLAAALAVEYGFQRQNHPLLIHSISAARILVYSALLFNIITKTRQGIFPIRNVKPTRIYRFLLYTAGIAILSDAFLQILEAQYQQTPIFQYCTLATRCLEAAIIALFLIELWQLNVILSRRFFKPGILLPLSFFWLIAVGTLLLKLPLAAAPGVQISWLDALFTMTSAVCVTGLATLDTATQFSTLGQTFILIFIQLGGLGIVIFGSVMAMLLGQRFSLRENLSLSSMLNNQPLDKLAGFIRFVVIASLAIECLGACLLIPLWPSHFTLDQRLGYSIFHSVSAFCNAGFALQSNSLISYQSTALVHAVLLPLIVIGGIGFPVLRNLLAICKDKLPKKKKQGHFIIKTTDQITKPKTLTLHTKIVLTTTASLYLAGVIGITLAQLTPKIINHATEKKQPITLSTVTQTLAHASFMSVSARTAGFNTLPMQKLEPGSKFTLMALMMVGASPGSTGGGMKTTALALLLIGAMGTLKAQKNPQVFARNITDDLLKKAATLAAGLIALVCITTFCLSLTESVPLDVLAFEAVSASTTTGLSIMDAPRTGLGKTIIICAMFLGRIGPITLLGTLLFKRRAKNTVEYPSETIIMG